MIFKTFADICNMLEFLKFYNFEFSINEGKINVVYPHGKNKTFDITNDSIHMNQIYYTLNQEYIKLHYNLNILEKMSKAFSDYLKYYNSNNLDNFHWKQFMQLDVAKNYSKKYDLTAQYVEDLWDAMECHSSIYVLKIGSTGCGEQLMEYLLNSTGDYHG